MFKLIIVTNHTYTPFFDFRRMHCVIKCSRWLFSEDDSKQHVFMIHIMFHAVYIIAGTYVYIAVKHRVRLPWFSKVVLHFMWHRCWLAIENHTRRHIYLPLRFCTPHRRDMDDMCLRGIFIAACFDKISPRPSVRLLGDRVVPCVCGDNYCRTSQSYRLKWTRQNNVNVVTWDQAVMLHFRKHFASIAARSDKIPASSRIYR